MRTATSAVLDGRTDRRRCSDPNTIAAATWPNCANKLFQFHHQPFNYYAAYAPGTEARTAHLRDEEEFLQLARSSTDACRLKPVSFVKPVGVENEHPGYASESVGSDHLVELLQAITDSRCAKDTMVIVTYDEFGGQWDHVTPPGQGGRPGVHDIWGPGTRLPLWWCPRFYVATSSSITRRMTRRPSSQLSRVASGCRR